ncbi:MAG: hypothetical protein MSH20_03630 [Lachnospiraceae bacterium]|nr:hypothetical protein [Lachnospiraceae bacterium]
MRLKYYLRGLGIGIVVTAVIMGVSAERQKPVMTDEQIIARAKELGMVEQEGILAEIAGESVAAVDQTEDAKAEAPKQEEAKAEAPKQEEAKAEPPKQEEAEAEAPKQEEAKAEAPEQEEVKAETPKQEEAKAEMPKTETADQEIAKPETVQKTSSVVVSIYPGEGSYTVSRKLAALGLVESADIYDKFLCQNGYDKKLCTGNYTITEGATADEIARILTKRQ